MAKKKAEDKHAKKCSIEEQNAGLLSTLLAAYTIGGETTPQGGLRDMLTDLMHIAKARKLDFDSALEGASDVFGEEDDAIAIYFNWNTDALERELKTKETIFNAQGGRGVELADEIDRIRTALAARSLANPV